MRRSPAVVVACCPRDVDLVLLRFDRGPGAMAAHLRRRVLAPRHLVDDPRVASTAGKVGFPVATVARRRVDPASSPAPPRRVAPAPRIRRAAITSAALRRLLRICRRDACRPDAAATSSATVRRSRIRWLGHDRQPGTHRWGSQPLPSRPGVQHILRLCHDQWRRIRLRDLGNVLYIGGSFTQVITTAGVSLPYFHLAALDATTGNPIAGWRADTDNSGPVLRR